jgi:hypothetical protein
MEMEKVGQKSCEKTNDRDTEEQKKIISSFLGTIKRYCGKWGDIFAGIRDEREAGKITYSLSALLFTGVMLFACQLGSRRQINHKLRGNETARKKYRALFGVEEIPHGDTLNYTYQRLKVEEVQEVVCRMMDKLMEYEELKKRRLFGIYYLIAVDGTGVLSFRERHCEFCLTQKLKNGEIRYYHPVLEAKLVTGNGYAFSLMSEFIENTDPQASKQDCELKAFYRLTERLKKRFPRISFCLLLDGLFAGGPTLDRCEKNDWKYLIVLTDNQEFEALLALPPETHLQIEIGKGVEQAYRWMNGIEYTDSQDLQHRINVLECVETSSDKQGKTTFTKFKWLTNFTLLSGNAPILANQAGRLRWKIENEGFNFQKNGGFCLEHGYSQNETAHKVFYLLLQIALTFFQLMAKSQFFKQAFPKGVGSLKNIAYRLLEAWRNLRLDDQSFLSLFDTS